LFITFISPMSSVFIYHKIKEEYMNISVRFLLLVLSFCLFLPAPVTADPYGSPFPVDSFTSTNLYAFDVSTGANGDSIVLWQQGDITNPTGYVQRYDAAGRSLQSQELSVGTGASRVAASGSGSYAVLSLQPDGSSYGVFVTIYNRAGAVIVGRFRVNDVATPPLANSATAIAMNANGQFAVAWTVGLGGNASSIYVKRYEANGAAAGVQAQAYSNTDPSYRIGNVDIAIDNSGNFVTSWDSGNIYSTEWYEVWARRFNSSGVALSAIFRVNTYTVGGQYSNQIAMAETGTFVIVWQGPLPDGTGLGVFGQRYSATGTALGGEFRINTQANKSIEGLGVAMAPSGSFVVSWHDDKVSVPPQIVARSYSNSGIAIGSVFVVSQAVNIWPTTARIGMDRSGNFFIGWLQHHYTISVDNRVYARRYSPTGLAIQTVANGQFVSPLSGSAGSWQYFKVSVPQGNNTLDVAISGGIGDADLYVRWGVLPTLNAWDGRPYLTGNNEAVRMLSFPPGDWYIGINGYSSYSSLSLRPISY
jgi:hypothetical protein